MKNRKGFTLVELIAVILIVGIISTIGVLTYTSISSSINEKEKQNILNKIGIVGKRYCEEKEVEEVYIKTLIGEGYLASENGKIKNPEDEREILNCYVYSAITGEITLPEGNDAKSTECKAIISDGQIKIKRCINGDCNRLEDIDYTKWYNDTNLKLVVTSDKVDLSQADYRWINFLDPSKEYKEKEFVIDLRAIKTVEGQIKVVVTSGGKTYKAETALKVDTKAPIIENIKVEDKWSSKIKITADLIDENSGIYGYVVSPNANPDEGLYYKKDGNRFSAEWEVTKNGTYYFCVLDNAGNKTCSDKITVDKVDDIAPVCNYSGESTSWAKTRTITYGCSDSGSGCDASYSGGSKTYNSDTTTATISYEIRDKAGNVTNCSKTVNVYVDATAPTCTYSGESTSWAKTRTINYGCSDSGSGCDASYSGGSKTYNSDTTTATISYEIRDKAGNVTSCSKEVNVYVDVTKPTCTYSGESTSWAKTRTINYGCSDSGSGCNSSYSGGQRVFDYTITTSPISYEIRDKAGNVTNCSKTANVYVDVAKPTCSISKTSTGTTSGVSASITCSDSNSGVSKCNGVASTSTTVSGVTTTTTYKVVDKAGNEGTCSLSVSSQLQKRTRSWNNCISGSPNSCVGGYYDPHNCKGSCKSTSYNTCQSSSCGCASYNSCRTSSCGCASYKRCSACGCQDYLWRGGGPSKDCDVYYACSSCGCSSYNSCRSSSCGCASYNSCQSSSCGSYCSSYYYNASCGNTAYDSCLTTKNTCSGGWNSWGSWSNVTSCTASDSVGCQILYY